MNILILASSPQGRDTEKIIDAAKKRKHKVSVLKPEELYLHVSDNEKGFDRVYHFTERLKSKDYDVIIPRIGSNLDYGASIVRHFNENLGIFSVQKADPMLTAANKWKSIQRLSSNGVKTPITVFASKPIHVDFLISKVGGLPAIAKTLKGSQGKGVMILETPLATNTALESFYKSDVELLLQEYVDGNSKDIRAIVIDGKVVSSMERTGKDDFRANISRGGSGRKISLTPKEEDLCIQAASSIGLDSAGVDLIRARSGESFIIEVNSNYGLKIMDITGDDVATEMIKYCERNTNRAKPEPQQNSYLLNSKVRYTDIEAKYRMKWLKRI